jgi:hypothetical protein
MTIKGYTVEAFKEAFSVYCPTNADSDRNNVTTLGAERGSDDYPGVTEPECDGSTNSSRFNGENACDGVTDQNEKIATMVEKDAEIDRLARADGSDGTTADFEASRVGAPAITSPVQLPWRTSREEF